MNWLYMMSYFFGGAFLANAVPHLVSGMTGRPFQSPFAKPPGEGLSSSTVNALWGFLNAAISYVLIVQVGDFQLRSKSDIVPHPSQSLEGWVKRFSGRFRDEFWWMDRELA